MDGIFLSKRNCAGLNTFLLLCDKDRVNGYGLSADEAADAMCQTAVLSQDPFQALTDEQVRCLMEASIDLNTVSCHKE